MQENSEIEKAREFILNWSTKKIDQHITYVLGTIGLLFTSMTLLGNFPVFSDNWNLSTLVVLMSISLSIFNGCKLIHWSMMNQFILTHKPMKFEFSGEKKEKYSPNYKWGFVEASKRAIIQGATENIQGGHVKWDIVLRYKIAKWIIGFNKLLLFIFLPFGLWILSFYLEILG